MGRPPPQRQLSKAQYNAIHDDTSINRGVRIAVLEALELATDPRSVFEHLCEGEQLEGTPTPFSKSDEIGRAMPKANFDRHLRSGWFGSRPIGASASRDLMNDMEDPRISPTAAGSLFRDALRVDPTAISSPRTIVSWYYHDPDSPLDACACVASDIAHRLALPDVFGRSIAPTDARPYYVLIALGKHLDKPTQPRFTDTGNLDFLEVWRPGGRTEPWIAGCKGLDEAVAAPMAFATHAVAVAFVHCHEP